MTAERALPTPSPTSEPYWKAAKNHEFIIQRCSRCKKYVFYPRSLCPYCLSHDVKWVKGSGKGTVYSWTAVYRATDPNFNEPVPYIYAIVELAEGPHMATNIVKCKPEQCKIGMPVEVAFHDVTPEVTLVKFQPAKK